MSSMKITIISVGKIKEAFYRDAIAEYSKRLSAYCKLTVREVTDEKTEQEGIEVRRIPAGKYAKFVIHGDMVKAVQNAWQEIWQMDLKRSFCYDFEEYQNSDMENAEIHIYVGLQE